MSKRKVIIIGSGPAGYTAAIYAARANLEPLMFEGFMTGPGGQLMTTTDVENYPGFPEGITGPAMMEAFKKQAQRFGTEILTEDVSEVDFSKKPFVVKGKEAFEADCVIIATGATAKRLDIPGAGDGEFWQKGVTACAVCDGAMPIFRDNHCFIIGGGDTAMEDGLFLTKYASKVTIVHRRDEFRASKIMAERALNHPKIDVAWNSVITKIDGDSVVKSVTLQDVNTKEEKTLDAAGVFFAIGHQPNTGFLNGQIELLDNQYIKVEPGTTKTNIPGVFAAGDVQDYVYRQAVSAAGSGCMAALDAERYLVENGLE